MTDLHRLASRLLAATALGIAAMGGTPVLADGPAVQEGRVIHTPWLALRFEQDGSYVPMVTSDTIRTEVYLQRRPFTIVLPVRGDDDTYRLAARMSDEIFVEADQDSRRNRLNPVEAAPYFAGGTGMADTAASSGTLMISTNGHHHLSGLRLGPDRDRHVFHVSEVLGLVGARELRVIEDVPGPLYLVAWFDEDGDGEMRHGEYEFLVLHLDGPGN